MVAVSLVLSPVNELITVPTQVGYVGKAANLYKAGYDLHGSAYVVNKLLGTTWLWDRVRVVGGAYGGFSDFDSHSGMFTYLSYRDPNLMKTVENYDGTVDYLKSLEIGGDELTKAIIGTMGDIDAYQLPDAKGYTSLMRHLLKVSDEERQERREQNLVDEPEGLQARSIHWFPIRPRWRGERRSLRTLPGASLRPPLAFNPRPRRLSTPTDAFQLHPDIRFVWNDPQSLWRSARGDARAGGQGVARSCPPEAAEKAVKERPDLDFKVTSVM